MMYDMSSNITSTVTEGILHVNKTSMESAIDSKSMDMPHSSHVVQAVHHRLDINTIFTAKNVYFLVFVALSIICFLIATLVRHHQQKQSQRKKEQEFLRYYHSVMPHSRIYGNLNDVFAPDTKSSFKLRRKQSKRKPPEKGNKHTEKLTEAMYKNYPYNPYVSEMEGQVIKDDIICETGLDITIENNEEAETTSNPELKIHLTKKKVMWRKYSFPSVTTKL